MQVDILDLIREADLEGSIYPGKKTIKAYRLDGAYKSHKVVFDWKDKNRLQVSLKAGTGLRDLESDELRKYPVSFQAPTYFDIDVMNDNEKKEEEEEGDSSKGKSGGGKKAPKKKRLEDYNISMSDFGKATKNTIPTAGKITKFVVMGKELAEHAFKKAYENLKSQLKQAKIMAIDIMKAAGKTIQKATPGGGLKAKGDETLKYKYDREKTISMFSGMSP